MFTFGRPGHRVLVDCCLTWSLALIDVRVCHTRPDLQDQVGKGSISDVLDSSRPASAAVILVACEVEVQRPVERAVERAARRCENTASAPRGFESRAVVAEHSPQVTTRETGPSSLTRQRAQLTSMTWETSRSTDRVPRSADLRSSYLRPGLSLYVTLPHTAPANGRDTPEVEDGRDGFDADFFCT